MEVLEFQSQGGTGRYHSISISIRGGTQAGTIYSLSLLTDNTCERSVLFPGVADCVFTLPLQAPILVSERRKDRYLDGKHVPFIFGLLLVPLHLTLKKHVTNPYIYKICRHRQRVDVVTFFRNIHYSQTLFWYILYYTRRIVSLALSAIARFPAIPAAVEFIY